MDQNKTPKTEPPKMGIGPGKMSTGFEKPKNAKTALRKLASYCKDKRVLLLFALLLALFASIFNIIGPSKLREITDLITAGFYGEMDLAKINSIGILLLILYSSAVLLNYFQGFIMATITQGVAKKLRTDLSQKINRLPLKYFDQHSYGDVLSRVTNDVDTIAQTMNQGLGQIASQLTTFIGVLIMMLLTNVIMTLSAIAATAIGFVLMMMIIKKSQGYFRNQQVYLGKINGHIEEIYSGHTIVKAYNAEEEAKKTFQEINSALYSSAWRSQFLSGLMMPIMSFIGNLSYLVVCITGAILTMKGSITFGVIVAFMMYIRMFTQPLSQIAQIANTLQSTAAASERVFEFLEETELEDESYKTTTLKNTRGKVEFKNVNFGYSKDKTIINNFSALANAGSKIAIVGPTGAGKTTLVNLLMRFYETDSGSILIDDIPITNLSRNQVHKQFCMVLQDTWIFEGTIKENIVYSEENVSEEEIQQVCKAVGIHKFITTLPKGYDTILNDKTSLSAGQKQLITIARAMINNAPLLILDEATSSVDTRTEKIIQESMDKLTVGRTSFVIAHRLSTIKNADLILVMKDGNIIESGTHKELLEAKTFYYDLYNSQFQDNDVA